jgi:hypothetical protein
MKNYWKIMYPNGYWKGFVATTWKLLKGVCFIGLHDEDRLRRKEWYESIVLPEYKGEYKFTFDMPFQIKAIGQFITFHEAYLLLAKYGYIKLNDYKGTGVNDTQGYYVPVDILEIDKVVNDLVASGQVKLPVGLVCWRLFVEYSDTPRHLWSPYQVRQYHKKLVKKNS